MKAEELRMNNWVKRDSQPDGFQVDERSFIVCKRDPNMFQPIPLTEDWLLKFGFEKASLNNVYFKHWGTNGLEIIVYGYHYKGVFEIELGKARFKSIEFIHHLQNLFYDLTGEELELK
jgi:hypothetical protein